MPQKESSKPKKKSVPVEELEALKKAIESQMFKAKLNGSYASRAQLRQMHDLISKYV